VRVENIEAAASDLGLGKSDLPAEPFALVDRSGVYFAPWPVAYTLARRVAVVFAKQVLADIGNEEHELQEGASGGRYVRYGREEYYHTPVYCSDQLRERQPLYGLTREWCDREVTERFDEIAGLRTEVMRLRGLLERAATQLKDSGHPHGARQSREELARGEIEGRHDNEKYYDHFTVDQR